MEAILYRQILDYNQANTSKTSVWQDQSQGSNTLGNRSVNSKEFEELSGCTFLQLCITKPQHNAKYLVTHSENHFHKYERSKMKNR